MIYSVLKKNDTRMMRIARKGYSLIEILIAITIVGMLIGGAMYLANTVMQNAKKSTTKTTLQTIKYALINYQQDKGEYPQSLQELVEAGLLPKPLPKDGWNKPFVYRVTEDGFEFYSHGGPLGKGEDKSKRIK